MIKNHLMLWQEGLMGCILLKLEVCATTEWLQADLMSLSHRDG